MCIGYAVSKLSEMNSKKLASFTLPEVLSLSKIGCYFSDIANGEEEGEVSSIVSKMEIYRLKKCGFEEKIINISSVSVCFLYNSENIIIYTPGMNPRFSGHYRIVLDAVLIPSNLIKGRVHSGILKIFHKMISKVRRELELISENYNKDLGDFNINICGHSMGGAISYLLGFYLKTKMLPDSENIKVLTFGAPRVFSPIAARQYQKIMKTCTLRATHGYSDFITGLAPAISGYSHIGVHLSLICGDVRTMDKRHYMNGYMNSISRLEKESEAFKESKMGSLITITSEVFRWGQEVAALATTFIARKILIGHNKIS